MKGAAVSAVTDHADALPNLDTIIRGLLYVYIFCLPFTRLLFVERNGFIILVVLLALWCWVNQRHFFTRTPIDLPLIAFIAWVAVTVPFSASPAYSVKEFAKLLQQGLIFYVVVYFFRDGRSRKHLVWLLVGGLFVVSAYGIVQFGQLIGVPLQEGRLMLVESVTSGEVWLSTYLVMLLPLSLALGLCAQRPSARVIGLVTVGVATLCLLLTYSRAGLLALLCEAAVLAWFVRRRTVMIGMAVSVLVVVLGSAALFQSNLTAAVGHKAATGRFIALPGSSTLEIRLEYWKAGMNALADHWIVGAGYGKESLRLEAGNRPDRGQVLATREAHNTFLDLALEVGVTGLALFAWLLGRILGKAFAAFRRADDPTAKAVALGVGVGVAGLAVRIFFDHMLIGTLALQFWVLVALAMVVYTDTSVRERAADASR